MPAVGVPDPAGGSAIAHHFEQPSADDLRNAVREAVGNVAVLAIATAGDLLSRPVGPAALKSIMAGVAIALDQLKRVGLDVDTDEAGESPRLIITEYTAKEIEAIQAEAEAEYGLTGAHDLDE